MLALLLPLAVATNFLVLVADDLGADRTDLFSDYGASAPQFVPATPTVDALASSGLAFTNAWANPVCSPTRAGLITGRFPFHTGVGDAVDTPNDPALDEGETTLPEALAAAGYESGLFGKWHLGFFGSAGTASPRGTVACDAGLPTLDGQDPSPIVHGFDTYAGGLGGEPAAYTGWSYTVGAGDGTTTTCTNTTDHPDDIWAVDAADWINARTGPFFAMVAFNAPHADGDGEQFEREWDDLSAACQAGIDPADACIRKGACGDSDGDGVDDAQDLLYRYQTECLDTTIGGLLDAIDPAILADTLIVFLGDNGTPGNNTATVNFLEDPYTRSVLASTGEVRYGKGTTFLSGVRVPLVVTDGRNWQEQEAGTPLTDWLVRAPGREVARGVIVEDVFPTLVALAGAPVVATDGADVSACLTSPSPACAGPVSRPQYAETYHIEADGSLSSGSGVLARGGYRLVTDYVQRDGCLVPSIYAAGDRWDEVDLYETITPDVPRALKHALERMGIGWLPRNALGRVSWCR